ncbi:ABC transporter permease [Sinorhizobium mexicanum]|uniref:ABC transporter permease n=1 Tax=Sinorhizobium mexicanum TaxID=375549 RepID=A0A859QZK5_9HYPH|nr:ABC transporter permease [Sinorhizobium mexicanum]MBP1884145.1 ribose transport system permease protein [Sinorhizobium mexicanum]QLL64859.1 ABC transporter permease [Sinorhizobium mexicanum]
MKTSVASNRALIAFIGVAVVFLLGMLFIPGFGSLFSVRAMLILASLLAIAALGQTLVMILGGIDLSIPFVIGFANVVFASLYGNGMPAVVSLLIVIALAACIGAISGGLSAGLSIHPLIVTLGIGTVVQAGVQIWTRGLPTGSAPPFINEFVSLGGTIGPLPFPWLIPFTLALTLGCRFVLQRTVYGRRLYALGSNLRAAELALVRPVAMWMTTFALSAVFAALAGILFLGFTGSSSATVGTPYLFQTVSAVVIGGTALIGGRGGFVGTVAGAVVLVELRTLLIGLGLSEALVQSALGILILALVAAYGRDQHIRNLI